MSALRDLASQHRIKASHRRRWKRSTGHSVYANNNPYTFVDPDGRQAIWVLDAMKLMVPPPPPPVYPNDISDEVVVSGGDGSRTGRDFTRRDRDGNPVFTQAETTPVGGDKPAPEGNTNPYDGPVTSPVVVVDGDGNAIPVGEGERITTSPNGDYQQVRDRDGNQTGTRMDKGGHPGQADPRAQGPHGHRPGVADETGNPHLPLNEPKPRP